MSQGTTIEWTQRPGTKPATLNPIRERLKETGKIGWHCVKKSEGCRGCYSESINIRLGTGLEFKPGLLENGTIELFLDEEMLARPYGWRHPHTIFWCSMTDFGADFVPYAWAAKIKDVQRGTSKHIHIELTKRPELVAPYLCGIAPIPNVWTGFSAERQQELDERWPYMREIAAKGWNIVVSIEPLIGPVDLTDDLLALGSRAHVLIGGASRQRRYHPPACDHGWIESLIEQCQVADVPVFVKQLGSLWAEVYNKTAPEGLASDRAATNWECWPERLRVREFPPAEVGAQ